MAYTDLRLRVTGFDGKSRNVTMNQMTQILEDDWEKFFKAIGDMRNFFKNLEPLIEQANKDAFELGIVSSQVGKHGYWAQKWRETVGADPKGHTLLATGRLMNSFKRLTSRSGKQKTLSYGFTAPYAQEITEDHTWTFGIDGDEYDESSSMTKTVEVKGRDYPGVVFDEIQATIMSDMLDMKWSEIEKVLKSGK